MKQNLQKIGIFTGSLAFFCTGASIEAKDLFQPEKNNLKQNSTTIIAQAPNSGEPEVLVPNPTIIIEDIDDNAQQPNPGIITNPTQPGFTPPVPNSPSFLPRAVAPPVGDIAVSNIDASLNRIDLGTDVIVPRLVLREAPVEEVLKLLGRTAGLNVVFTSAPSATGELISPTISLDLENQSVEEVFNSVLMVSGLQANRRGNTLFIGASLPDGARNLISRTLRLNQANVENAAVFLAAQGAEVQRLVTPVTEVRDPETNRVVERIEEAAQLDPITATPAEGSTAPLLLSGLRVSTDTRLNSISLIGEPRQIEIATAFLVQLDARRRQVAINVKVIDINLLNTNRFSSSFSFGFDDGFFVQDDGTAILNFGEAQPPNAAQTRGSTFYPTIVPLNSTVGGAEIDVFLDEQNAPFDNINRGTTDFTPGRTVPYARPSFGRNNNPFQPGLAEIDVPEDGPIEYTYELPSLFQYPQRFLLQLESEIQTGNAKILTDPTLVVQEGQGAAVQLTQQVVTSVQTEVDPLSGVRTTTPIIQDAGLVLGVEVERIDDNGFINFFVNPTINSLGPTQEFDSGAGSVNQITLLNTRALASGLIRLRDGQTLILSGIIEDSERTTVSKVPILGDLPVLGALFRSTNSQNERREVIIMLTPKLIDENAGYGSNYRPTPDAREMLQQRGFTTPTPDAVE